jgi:3-deoxy-D-manno-octulosonic-acid transferase
MGVDCAKWSSYNSEKDRNKSILIIDNIGQLGKVYSYASFAYVGGGMKKNGLHNTLEPAAYGIPIIIGEHYNRYEEAVSLLKSGGMISVKSAAEFKEITHKLINDKKLTQQMGENNNQYILSGKGASQLILKKIESLSGL